ncbi:MAG: N-acetyltransferase [Flavobacteriaceae bacterium]|nr:MAG: N-acetyltransferase [Flavobacteriaceae bacterium]
MNFYLETERLILRDLLESDVDGIFELDSDPLVHEYLGKKPISTIKEAEEIVGFIRDQYEKRGIGRFAAIEKSSGNFIGWSGLKFNTGDKETIGKKRDFYDIGYRLIPRFWNKGYATESALACLDFGFSNLELNKIVGAAETGNIASNKVLKRIGLKYVEQFLLDDEMINWYELKKEDHGKEMS